MGFYNYLAADDSPAEDAPESDLDVWEKRGYDAYDIANNL